MYMCRCLCMCVYMYVSVCVYMSKGSLQKSVLFFCHVPSGNKLIYQTGQSQFPAEPSHQPIKSTL